MSEFEERQIADREADDAYPVDARGFTDTGGASPYVGLSTSYLHKARHFGDGPEFVKLGRAVRYSFAALDVWAARQRRRCTRDDPGGEK